MTKLVARIRRCKLFHPVAAVAAALLLGCSSGGGGGGSGGSGGGSGGSGGSGPEPITSPACSDPSAKIAITDETNYSLSDSFTIARKVLKDATDLTFEWGGVTRDFFGKSVDAAQDIDLVLISLWKLTPSAIEDALKNDNLALSSNVGVVTSYPDGSYTSKNLLDFNLLGNPLTPDQVWKYFDTKNANFQYPQDQYTFFIMASSGTVPGKQPRMMAFFTIDPSATETKLALTNDSTKLDYTVHLATARPMRVPAATPSLTIDWKQMTRNALGNEYVYAQITQAAVAHFPGKTVADLERDFLRLDEIAGGWWSGEVTSGTSINLGNLKDPSGASFPGIDSDGVWLTALYCAENCNNPAPWSLTILQPCK